MLDYDDGCTELGQGYCKWWDRGECVCGLAFDLGGQYVSRAASPSRAVVGFHQKSSHTSHRGTVEMSTRNRIYYNNHGRSVVNHMTRYPPPPPYTDTHTLSRSSRIDIVLTSHDSHSERSLPSHLVHPLSSRVQDLLKRGHLPLELLLDRQPRPSPQLRFQPSPLVRLDSRLCLLLQRLSLAPGVYTRCEAPDTARRAGGGRGGLADGISESGERGEEVI